MNSSNWKLCNDCSPKQIALFKSVVSLLEEGVSAANMKVSEIAARAGVGKGTTYEYFKSKEELIAEAIFYDLGIRLTELAGRVEAIDGFKDRFFTILQWLEENLHANHVLSRILGVEGMDTQISNEMYYMVKNHTEEIHYIQEGLAGLLYTAEKDGLISYQIPQSLRNLSFINQMFSYVVYLKMQDSITDVSKSEIKEFLYTSLIRALQA